jgi:hypothetical protein
MPPTFDYTVDEEPQSTTEHQLTVRQILDKAGLDSSSHYLVQLKGNHRETLTDLDAVIHMHEHMKFISVSTQPTPVS